MKASGRAVLLASAALTFVGGGAVAQTAAPATPPAAAAVPPGNPSDAAGAVAQSQPTGDGTQESGGARTGLEEIVVTATRRTVDLQRVTATVEAVPANTLKAFNVTSVLQLPSLVSGLVVTPSGGNNLYLRGLGAPSTGFNEAEVAVYVDGLYTANPTAGIFSFNNIDRIEVLKGPQGTLYGRNVTGGLISVTTRDPSPDKTRVDASLQVANYDTIVINAYGSAPLTDDLAANIAYYHQKQGQGWSTNVFNGHDAQKSIENGLETKLQWRPDSGLKATLSFIYDYNNRDYGYDYEVAPGTIGTDGTQYLGRYRFASRIDAHAPTSIYIGTLKLEQDLGFATLMSLTGYQTSTANVLFQGGSPLLGQPKAGQSPTYDPFYEHDSTFSQEFQLTSKPSSSRFDWVAGAFYYDSHDELRLDSYFVCTNGSLPCAPGTPTRNDGHPSTLSGSVYGDGTFRFFEATRLTVGLRYTDERKTLSGLLTPLPGLPDSVAVIPGSVPAAGQLVASTGVTYPGEPYTIAGTAYPGIPTTLHFQKLTYRFVLAQDIGNNIHLYASHNLGFKSGAFNANVFTNPPVQPELLYATEAGFKSELFDRRVRLNVAYFHYAFKNVQLRSTAPPAPAGNALLLNAASERSDGVDGDFSIAAAKGLIINGSFEYLDAKFVNFPGTTIATINRDANGNVLPGVTVAQNQNLAGYAVPFGAPFSASIGATYTIETSSGNFSLSGNDHYNSPYSMNADNSIRQMRHHVIDASLNWTAPDKRFDANLFVRNLTQQYVYAVANVTTNIAIVPAAPRTFGVSVGVHY